MKKSLILSIVTSAVITAGGDIHPIEPVIEITEYQVPSLNSLSDVLENGKFIVNMRTFYMNRSFDEDKTEKHNTKALTAGGILKYESGDFYGLKFSFSYFGSHKIGDFFERTEGINTSLLQSNGDDISFLGEAYLQYDLGNTILKVGRQRLDTPLIEDHDLRLLPSTYEAAIIRNKDIPNTLVEVGYVKRYSGFVSTLSGFYDNNMEWGKDGIGYIFVQNTSIDNLTLRGQYIKTLSDIDNTKNSIAIDAYKYIDMKYNLPIGINTYVKAQYGSNTYNNADDSTLLGVKVGTSIFDKVNLALLYNKIIGNSFQSIEAGPVYTDWFQGYSAFEESNAFGGELTFNITNHLSFKTGYVKVNSSNKNYIDDFSEFIFDGNYIINNSSKIRIIYSKKDQSSISEQLRYDSDVLNGGNEDRNDFRIIYYLNF